MRNRILLAATLGIFTLAPASLGAQEEPIVLCIVSSTGDVGTCVPTAELPPEKRKLGPIAGPDGNKAGEVVAGTLELVTRAEKNLPLSRARCQEESGDPQGCEQIFARAEADIAKSRQVLETSQ